MSRADVAVFVFDAADPASFEAAQKLLVGISDAVGNTLPCVLVAAKDDLGLSSVSALLLFMASSSPALDVEQCMQLRFAAKQQMQAVVYLSTVLASCKISSVCSCQHSLAFASATGTGGTSV